MKPAPALAANQVFPANGSSVSGGQPRLTRAEMRDALNEMPHMAAALAPAPPPRDEETLDHEPGFVPSSPAPRG